MRIISGKFRGKQIHPPSGLPVRPTTDFAKEGLFNILNNLVDIEELKILDLFAGTGSISYEFFSRDCLEVTAVDNNPKCVAFIERTAESMKAENLNAIRADAFRFIQFPGTAYNLIFADPPYDMKKLTQSRIKSWQAWSSWKMAGLFLNIQGIMISPITLCFRITVNTEM